MPQSLANILLHIVFSTKGRTPFLADPAVRVEMNSYLAGALRNLGSPAVTIGSDRDHVHILCSLSKNLSAAKVVEEIKKSSSKWAKTKGLRHFQWQRGYGAFSVSPSNVERVRKYIQNQERHHARVSFQEEFRLLLQKNGVQYDERYVWD